MSPERPHTDTPRRHAIDEALAALPARAPDPVSAERIRLRARVELASATRPGAWGRRWYALEPYATGAVVLAFLGWTALKLAVILS